jgi:AraC family transcriptional regulator, transcriptional activator FtrA
MRLLKSPSLSRGRAKHVVAVLVVPDTVGLEIAIAQQVFGPRMSTFARITGDTDTPYEVVLCGETDRVLLSSGTDPGPLASLEVLTTADTVLVPGIELPLSTRSSELLASLTTAQDNGARMISFCAGAFILGFAGVLDGRRATTHWMLTKEFRALFPRCRLEPELLFVDDEDVHTSGGVFSATDLALHILAEDLGRAYSNDFGRILVSAPQRPGGQAQFIKNSIRADSTPVGGSLLEWLLEHLDEPLTLADLAAREHVSERSLVRRFRLETGMSVFDWITQARVDKAKSLLETTDLRVGEIAAMVGLGSAESLRRNLSRLAGTNASAYRAAFRPEAQTA